MIEFLFEYGMFLAKIVTVVVAILFVVGGVLSTASRFRHHEEDGEIRVKHLNRELENLKEGIRHAVMPAGQRKQAIKAQRKADKARLKAEKKVDPAEAAKSKVYVLDFNGDIRASEVDNLRREISAVLQLAEGNDEVVIRLESPGGVVHGYGLAASQLRRIRSKGVRLTVCVDKVAASGGYMMACIGDRIIAAPFAVLGSIGVVAQIPNIHRLLKKNDIDIELLTAGEYKRTLTVLGENTDKAREKFQEEIEDTHLLFKDFVSENRRGLELARVATGEHWFGKRALELGLIDELKTSDEYLLERCEEADVFEVSWHAKQKLAEKLGFHFEGALERVIEKWFHRASKRLPF